MKKMLKLAALLLVSSVFFFACKKKNNEAPYEPLKGIWEETLTGNYQRKLVFKEGGKFTMYLSNTNDANYLLTLNGTYAINGENLTVNITEEVARQSNGTTVTTPLNQYNIFEKGTFSINNFLLTINYTTYPADAPVKTQAKFKRIIG
ncbi:hypothetical protein [Pedobacter nototheniae]|uniref:hypothetical protein n=1 Tax=Pedobacter nototheniae TaxID=2488994 RepID=UPI00292D1AC5|nr:hypothetical protein [Pedobacter nototheniae]